MSRASERCCNTGFYASHQSERLMHVARLSVDLYWDTVRAVGARQALGKTSELGAYCTASDSLPAESSDAGYGGWKSIATLRLIHVAMSCGTCPGLSLMDWLKPGYNWAALCCGIPELPQTMLDTVA